MLIVPFWKAYCLGDSWDKKFRESLYGQIRDGSYIQLLRTYYGFSTMFNIMQLVFLYKMIHVMGTND